jgi:protein-ribulosamine 3-kinase
VKLPAAVAAEIEGLLQENIRQVSSVAGGCIHSALRVDTDRASYFAKHGDLSAGVMFEAEAFALGEIGKTQTVRVPAVIGRAPRWLLLEWLEPGSPRRDGWRSFGAELALMHRARSDRFGWSQPNFIGSLPQQNDWADSWPRFWQERRLQPQLEQARRRGLLGSGDVETFEVLFREIPERLSTTTAEGASLLHGDLWSGNAHGYANGIAAVDPSAYYGHREVDLAMAALFGGFPQSFWDGYSEVWPLERAGFEQRRAIYQLYYLLVHVNLFGAGYVAGTREALRSALRKG